MTFNYYLKKTCDEYQHRPAVQLISITQTTFQKTTAHTHTAAKKQARGKAASGGPLDASKLEQKPELSENGINAEIWLKHMQNVQKVMNHPLFANIDSMHPFGISNKEDEVSGFQEAYDKKKAMIALTKAGKYKCGVNLAWVNTFYASSENVPVMWSSVEDMVRQYFSTPASMPDNLTLVCAFTDLKELDKFGHWKRVSPEELPMAWFHKVAQDIDNNAPDETLIEWRNHMLTTPATLHLVDGLDKIKWMACQIREDIESNVTLARTVVQRIYEIIQKRTELKCESSKELHEMYTKHLRMAKSDAAPSTKGFIDMALTIWDRALCLPSVSKVVLEEEALRNKSVFNSISKMQMIVQKAKTPARIEWTFQLAFDYKKAGYLTNDAFSLRALEGKVPGANGRGLVDMYICKLELKEYLLTDLLRKKNLDSKCLATITDVTKSPDSFRQYSGYKSLDAVIPDLSWRAGWPTSCDLALGLIEDMNL